MKTLIQKGIFKKNFNFEKKELIDVFDGIITKDFKSGFDFGAHDLSVNDYLKNAKNKVFKEFVELK